jgi:iron complex outermembrane receptor protein
MTHQASASAPNSSLLRQAISGVLGTTLACFASAAFAIPQSAGGSTIELGTTSALKRLSLDELMNVKVSSVSKTREDLFSAPAAITVVSSEDIERSGATNIPEALRLVPGLHIARRNSSVWAMGSRGFSGSNSEKLLVLSDTRSLYTPLISGVFWDAQQYVLEDIERIEVIRGPGAALWGSNAVNGVINITTKNARDTHGGYLAASVGTEEKIDIGARYGTAINDDLHVRAFANHAERDDTFHRNTAQSDDWRHTRLGFRADWDVTDADAVTLQGGAYRGEIGQYSPGVQLIGRAGPTGDLVGRANGGNILGRWRHRLGPDSDFQARFYYDRTHRDDPSFRDTLDTYDLDFQHHLRFGNFAGAMSHDVIWGLNYRFTDNTNTGRVIFKLDPPSSTDSVVSAFVQDQLTLSESVRLTVGSKFEHNDFSGFEIQPSMRASWDATPTINVWGAVSQAVRVPTRVERDVAIDLSDDPTASPTGRLEGNEDFESEELIAYELGTRWRVGDRWFIDLAAFHHRYEGLVSLEFGDPFVDPADSRVILPILNRNLTDGSSQGIELLATFDPWEDWRWTASYAYIDLSLDPKGQDLNRGELLEGATPRHQFALRSSLNLTETVQFDLQFRTLSAVRSSPEIISGGIRGYSEIDMRLGWRATEQLHVSIVGQNLLNDKHVEFGSIEARGEIERGVYGKAAWHF